MSSQPRLCGAANAGSGGADPVAINPIGSGALGHARPDRFVETGQPEHQNAKSHGRRPTSCSLIAAASLSPCIHGLRAQSLKKRGQAVRQGFGMRVAIEGAEPWPKL